MWCLVVVVYILISIKILHRSHLHEREEAERKTNIIHKKLDELVVKVTSFFGIQISTSADGMDLLISKVSELS